MSISDEIERIHNKQLHNYSHDPHESAYLDDDIYFPENMICEQIENSTKSIQEPFERQIKAVESIADSAKKTANKADIKGWIAIIISGLALFFEFAINHAEIIDFVKSLFNN